MIEKFVKKQFHKINPATWALLAMGFMVYIPFLSKQLNCADTNVYGYLYHINGYGYEDALGRFLIKYFVQWRNDINSNVLTVGLSIVFLCILSEIITRIFEFKSTFTSFMVGALLLFSAASADLFTYVYTTDVYCFAFLLVGVGTYFLLKKEEIWAKVAAAVLFIASMSFYQAYIGFALFIITVFLLRSLWTRKNELVENKSLRDEASVKTVFFRDIVPAFINYLVVGISMVVYLVLLKLLDKLSLIQMESTRGTDNMMANFLVNFFNEVREAYRGFFEYFFTDIINFNSWFGRKYINLGVLLLLFVVLLTLVIKNKIYKNVVSLVTGIVLVAVMPLILCLIVILSPESSIYAETGVLMLPFINGFYMLPIILLDGDIILRNVHPDEGDVIGNKKQDIIVSTLDFGCKLFVTLSIIIMIVFVEVFAKEVELQQNQLAQLANRVVTRIEMMDDYVPNEKVLVVGRPHDGLYPLPNSRFELITKNMISHYSQIFGASDQISEGWIKAFDYYVGVKYEAVTPEERDALLGSSEVMDMGIFPAENSIRRVGDVTVVKFSETH